MSKRLAPKVGEFDVKRGSNLDYCKHPGCCEFAQTSDPSCQDTRKYYCTVHEAAAVARGESGEREAIPERLSMVPQVDDVRRAERNAEIRAELAAGRIPGQSQTDPCEIRPAFSPAPAAEQVTPANCAFPTAVAPDPQPATSPEIPAPETSPTPAAPETPDALQKESDMPETPKNRGRRPRPVEEVKDGLVINTWTSVTEAEKAIGAGTNTLAFRIKRKGGICMGRQFRFAGEQAYGPASKPPRPRRSASPVPERNKLCEVQVLPDAPDAPTDRHPSHLSTVLSGIAAMAIGTRELVLSDVEIEQIGNATTIKIKQVSIRAAASSALAR